MFGNSIFSGIFPRILESDVNISVIQRKILTNSEAADAQI